VSGRCRLGGRSGVKPSELLILQQPPFPHSIVASAEQADCGKMPEGCGTPTEDRRPRDPEGGDGDAVSIPVSTLGPGRSRASSTRVDDQSRVFHVVSRWLLLDTEAVDATPQARPCRAILGEEVPPYESR
jgi:hypothetical protein